jgi:hypothetical protein
MNKKHGFLALLVLVLAFGMMVVGCGDNLSGTWKRDIRFANSPETGTHTITFSGRNFKTNSSGNLGNLNEIVGGPLFAKPTKGTYNVSDGKIKFHVKAVRNRDSDKWESWSGPDVEQTLIRTGGTIEIAGRQFTR